MGIDRNTFSSINIEFNIKMNSMGNNNDRSAEKINDNPGFKVLVKYPVITMFNPLTKKAGHNIPI
jgi:hypothetical protein